MVERILVTSREAWLAELGRATGLESVQLADCPVESLPAFAQVEVIATVGTTGAHITDAELTGRLTVGELYNRALSCAIEAQMSQRDGR